MLCVWRSEGDTNCPRFQGIFQEFKGCRIYKENEGFDLCVSMTVLRSARDRGNKKEDVVPINYKNDLSNTFVYATFFLFMAKSKCAAISLDIVCSVLEISSYLRQKYIVLTNFTTRVT